jgi:hypothetical protein
VDATLNETALSLGAHLAIYDTVAAPKSLLPRCALRTQRDVVFLCELGALSAVRSFGTVLLTFL